MWEIDNLGPGGQGQKCKFERQQQIPRTRPWPGGSVGWSTVLYALRLWVRSLFDVHDWKATNQCFSVHILSLSLSQINKHILGWGFKNKSPDVGPIQEHEPQASAPKGQTTRVRLSGACGAGAGIKLNSETNYGPSQEPCLTHIPVGLTPQPG